MARKPRPYLDHGMLISYQDDIDTAPVSLNFENSGDGKKWLLQNFGKHKMVQFVFYPKAKGNMHKLSDFLK